jgi:arsenate reductase
LIRTGEVIYKENYSQKELSDSESIEAMVAHPILIERPIVVCNSKAAIGRPPENVLTIL